MEKLKIFVCAHKSDPSTRNTLPFVPIQGGKELHKDIDLGYICDNTGDNISNKNNKYSEWSVIYWIWKNVKDVEYIGLNHYRRYFGIDINESNIDKLCKIKHLSYIGNAQIKNNVNIGAGVVISNYNGITKNQAYIDSYSFIGSNSTLVSPISIGYNCYIGAGSVVNKSMTGEDIIIDNGEKLKSNFIW